jgi:hypothetical protein
LGVSSEIRSLEVAIGRLEAAVGKGRGNCPACRTNLRPTLNDPTTPSAPPESLVKTKCEFCLTEHTVDLSSIAKDEREIYRLIYTYTLEDQYADPKANAFHMWFYYRFSLEKKRGNPPVANR